LEDEAYRSKLLEVIQLMFTQCKEDDNCIFLYVESSQKGASTKLAVQGFDLGQVWAQLAHHTERSNQQALSALQRLIASEDFLRGLDDLSDNEDGNASS
jgi:hypothetical protein